MKRLILSLILISSLTILYAQPRAIGGRVVSGLEFSYQHALNTSNMLSLDAGVCFVNGAEFAITYDWINPGGKDFSSVWSGRGVWNWYVGVGAAAGGYWNFYNYLYAYGFAGVAGRIGFEYNFWFPLQLSFDYRPVFGAAFNKDAADFYQPGLYQGSIGLGVRYRF